MSLDYLLFILWYNVDVMDLYYIVFYNFWVFSCIRDKIIFWGVMIGLFIKVGEVKYFVLVEGCIIYLNNNNNKSNSFI